MTGILPVTARIKSNYKQSLYEAGFIRVKTGFYPLNIPKSLRNKELVMFSAYNPGGRRKVDGWNRKMMEKLSLYLTNYYYVKGKGSLKQFSEPLFMVVMDLRKARVLARKFRQNAIVVLKYQRLSRLDFLA